MPAVSRAQARSNSARGSSRGRSPASLSMLRTSSRGGSVSATSQSAASRESQSGPSSISFIRTLSG
jgi:hypothetical protein